ncbi:hypothetical protein GSQ51_17685 [Clostridioides difficile]|nr:hypothetical protein [Clostridioides difficile]NJK15920.1 hypothetical protein [Clostridioides difficile]
MSKIFFDIDKEAGVSTCDNLSLIERTLRGVNGDDLKVKVGYFSTDYNKKLNKIQDNSFKRNILFISSYGDTYGNCEFSSILSMISCAWFNQINWKFCNPGFDVYYLFYNQQNLNKINYDERKFTEELYKSSGDYSLVVSCLSNISSSAYTSHLKDKDFLIELKLENMNHDLKTYEAIKNTGIYIQNKFDFVRELLTFRKVIRNVKEQQNWTNKFNLTTSDMAKDIFQTIAKVPIEANFFNVFVHELCHVVELYHNCGMLNPDDIGKDKHVEFSHAVIFFPIIGHYLQNFPALSFTNVKDLMIRFLQII